MGNAIWCMAEFGIWPGSTITLIRAEIMEVVLGAKTCAPRSRITPPRGLPGGHYH